MGEKVILNTGFAVWIGDIIVTNGCASRLDGVSCRIDSQKTDDTAFVFEEIERGWWPAVGFLDIKKIWRGQCFLEPPFEVGAVDPEFGVQRWNQRVFSVCSPVEVK